MNKKIGISFLFLCIIVLTGCESNDNSESLSGTSINSSLSNESSSNNEIEIIDKNSEEFKQLLEEYSSKVVVAGLGIITPTGFGYNNQLGLDGTEKELIPYNYIDEEFSEDIDLYIESVSIAKIDLEESGKAFFNQNGPLQVVMVDMKIKNQSESSGFYAASLTKLIVEGNEIFAEPSMSEDNNNLDDLIPPGESVEGVAVFVFDNVDIPEKISLDVSQFFVSTPVGREELLEFEILDIEQSILKDNN